MKDFTQGNVPRQLLSFAIPLLCTNLIQALYQAIDALWVGRLIGSGALAAVATTLPIILLTLSLLVGLGVATSILFGQAYGAGNHPMLARILSTSLVLSLLLALGVTAVGLVWADPILRLIRVPAGIHHDATVFLRIVIGGLIFSVMYQWFSGIFNGIGDSRTPFAILLVTVALNAGLAPLLIRGWRFIPPLHIAGSALATVFANLAGCAIATAVFRRHRLLAGLGLSFKPDGGVARALFTIGLPLSLQMIVVSLSFLLVMTLANRFGETVTAAYGIGSRIDTFVHLAIMAVTAAVSAMTAQNLGARQFGRIGEIVKWALAAALGLALLFFAAAMLLPERISAWFTQDPAVIRETVLYFRISSVSYIGIAFLFCLQGVIRGAGDTFSSFLIVAAAMILVRMPLCFVLAEYTPLRQYGLWLGMTLSIFIGGLTFAWYYRSGRWKTRRPLR